MSDLKRVMTLEKLPNEILIECFKYLNAVDIFYSFDQLNSRFNNLIRCIRLYVNFENVRKSIFDQFCAKILSNPEIKNEIISLKLSNKDTWHQIDQFLSLFSLDKFCNLQSLTLNDIKDNIEKIEPILPLMLKLSCFRSIDSKYNLSTIVQLSHLQTLAIYNLSFCTYNIDQIFSLVNLTISKCSLKELYKFLSCTPMLKYLNVYTLVNNAYDELQYLWNKTYSTRHNARNLQKIILNDLQENFKNFEIFLQQTPNLKSLKISSNYTTMINADNWQHLITTSLHNLNIFKFNFTCGREKNDEIIVNKFKQFENSFWQDQHHWIIEYVLEKYVAYIYTIPYISNTYKLAPTTNRFSNKLINDVINLKNVTNLILYPKTMKDKTEFKYYFSNVETLTLHDELHHYEYWYFDFQPKHVQLLKMIVNLNNLKHLNISSILALDLPLVLLEILKHSPQLSSLTIIPYELPMLYTDENLCIYLNNKIKQLDIYVKYGSTMDEFGTIVKFCEVFSNVERLKCNIHQMDDILYLLKNLRKLLFLNIIVPFTKQTCVDQLEYKISNLNITYEIIPHYSDDEVDKAEICMWMG